VLLSYLANCSFVFLVVAVWAALQLWCWLQAARRVEHIAGHRAGAEGYAGKLLSRRCMTHFHLPAITSHAVHLLSVTYLTSLATDLLAVAEMLPVCEEGKMVCACRHGL
jgi:hypothetical protein